MWIRAMRFFALLPLCALLLAAHPVSAFDGKTTIGVGRLLSNDSFVDGRDRWQTGSYTYSNVRGSGWSGALPDRPGEIVEYRLRASLAAPESLRNPAPGDRRYAPTLSFGAHTHFEDRGFQHSAGLDLVAIGPMTGIGAIQSAIHDIFGVPDPSAAQALQLDNAVYPTATFEIARPFTFGSAVTVRPFVEAIAGAEVLGRVGADIEIGRLGQGELQLRETITGQRYYAIHGENTGFALTMGGDIAAVASSAYYPVTLGYTVNDTRSRLRAGLRYKGERFGGFYGVTYLSPEFRGQRSGQFVASLRVSLDF